MTGSYDPNDKKLLVNIETNSLGIHTNSFNPLKAYPNPVNSQLTIENNEAILGINIVSLDGKIMQQITDLNGSTGLICYDYLFIMIFYFAYHASTSSINNAYYINLRCIWVEFNFFHNTFNFIPLQS